MRAGRPRRSPGRASLISMMEERGILIDGARGFPVAKVWKRLTEDQFDGLGGYCRALRFVLENQTKRRAEGP